MKQFEGEEWVIGAILNNPENFETAKLSLSASDFLKYSHRKIFKAMEDLDRNGTPLDLSTISALLKGSKDKDRWEDEIEIVKFLKDDVPTGATLRHWIGVVKKRSLEIYLREEASKENLDSKKVERLAYDINTLHDDSILYLPIMDVISVSEDPKARIKTGFRDLDRNLPLSAGRLWTVSGRTGEGKTSLGLQALYHISKTRPVGIVSLEMSAGEVKDRILNSFGSLPENFFISDPSTLSSLDLKHRCKVMQSEQGVEVVLVDYLQLMREREDFRSRHLEVSHIIRRVKEFAKELKLAFIVISSVSRGNEELPPTLSLLKESGDIEFASDGVVFIHSEKEKEDLKFLNIAKNRWGWTGEVKIFWDGPKTKFRDYQKEGIDESD